MRRQRWLKRKSGKYGEAGRWHTGGRWVTRVTGEVILSALHTSEWQWQASLSRGNQLFKVQRLPGCRGTLGQRGAVCSKRREKREWRERQRATT